MSNRAGIQMAAREAATEQLMELDINPLTTRGEAWISGYVRSHLNGAVTTRQQAERMAIRKGQAQLHARGMTRVGLAGEIAGYEALAQRADDGDSSDDEPVKEHKFKGGNLKKCADCGMGINAKVHKPSWPPSHKD